MSEASGQLYPEGLMRGIVPVAPTPLTPDEAVDLAALAGLVEFAVAAGVPALCLPAYGSEFYKLSDAERSSVVATAIKQAGGRVKVMAQSNHPSSRLAAEMARRYEGMGADLISFAIPRLFALSDDDVLRYCESVSSAVSGASWIPEESPGPSSPPGWRTTANMVAPCPGSFSAPLQFFPLPRSSSPGSTPDTSPRESIA